MQRISRTEKTEKKKKNQLLHLHKYLSASDSPKIFVAFCILSDSLPLFTCVEHFKVQSLVDFWKCTGCS